jgi:cell division protein FtsL
MTIDPGILSAFILGMMSIFLMLVINVVVVAYKYGQLNNEVKRLRADLSADAVLHKEMAATMRDLSTKIVKLEHLLEDTRAR